MCAHKKKKESQPTDVRHQQLEGNSPPQNFPLLDNPIASIIGDTALSGIIEDGDTDAQAGPSNIQIEVSPMVLLLEESEEPGPSIVPSVHRAPRVLVEVSH
ncbi:unnamed protein product [Arctogadus glacialis]